MALLLEKCEQATQTPDCPSADSFDVDIHAFVQQQEQKQKPILSDDPELDNLVRKMKRKSMLITNRAYNIFWSPTNQFLGLELHKKETGTYISIKNVPRSHRHA